MISSGSRLGAAIGRVLGLRREAPPRPPAALRPAGERIRLLVVSPFYLFPVRHGAAVRAIELLRRLSHGCDLQVLIAIGGTDDPLQRDFLSAFCRGVHFHQVTPGAPRIEDLGLPRRACELTSWTLAQRIRGLAFAHDIDLVQLENSDLAALAGLPTPARTILVELDLTYRSVERRSGAWRGTDRREERARWLRLERTAWRGCDQVHFMSEVDRDEAAARAPDVAGRARVVPNGATFPDGVAGDLETVDGAVLFIGSFPHLPNQEALRFLVTEIWPRVRAADGQRELLVVGAGAPAWVSELDGRDGVRVAGEVDDLKPWYRRAAVSAVPILSGSGTRLKILESIAHGVPVVSTRVGAEGLDGLVDGVGLLLADEAGAFARRLLELLGDRDLRREVARRGRAVVAERYDWGRIAEGLLGSYRELPASGAQPERMGRDERADPRPEISVVVDALSEGAEPERSLEALDRQIEQRFEVLLLLRPGDPSIDPPASLRGRLAELRCPEAPYGPGRLARAALRAARGRIVAFLDARARPDGEHWLAHLTWSLFQPSPPSAVEGRAVDAAGADVAGPRLLDDASGSARGTGLSFRNSAMKRSHLESFPPPGEGPLAALAWTLLVTRSGGWILQEPKARVAYEEPAGASDPARAPAVAGGDAGIRASVVVCTRDRAADLQATLDALAGQAAGFDWEVVVVDNGSVDDTPLVVEAARRASARPVRGVVEPVVGLSAARNAGARLARGEWLVFLDDDTAPAPGWLDAYAHAFERAEVAGAGGPVDAWLSGELPFWLGDEYLPYLSVWDRGPIVSELRYNEYPRGANMAFRRAVLERLGGFSRQLGRSGRSLRSCEEIELFLRIERSGGTIVYLPAARTFHRVRGERLNAGWMRRRYAAQGFSEAIIDWKHWGAEGLRRGLARAASRVASGAELGGLPRELDRSFHRAARRAYRLGALYAMVAVARSASVGPVDALPLAAR